MFTASPAFTSATLVGRDDERLQLTRALAAAQAGRGQAVFISAGMGLGKTRLVRDFLYAAATAEIPCLKGRAFATEPPLPNSLLVDAISSSRDEVSVSAIADQSYPVQNRVRASLEILDRFFRDANSRGRILFLDDLHWADAESVGAVHLLIRRHAANRALVIATYRPDEAVPGSALNEMMLSLRSLGRITDLALRPLSRDQTQIVVKQILHYKEDLSPAFLDLLFRQSGGNPFFIEQLLQALVENGDIYLRDGSWLRKPIHSLEVPATLREMFLGRFRNAREHERRLLALAASAGPDATHSLLAIASGLSSDDLDDALAGLCHHGVLVELNAPLRYQFAHPLCRTILYESLTETERRREHRQIASAMNARSAEDTYPGSRLAWHLGKAAEDGAEQSHRQWSGAEAAWHDGDAGEAYRMYVLAAATAARLDMADRVLYLSKLAEARTAMGDLSQAAESWRMVLELEDGREGSEPFERARRELGTLLWEMGDSQGALATLRGAPQQNAAQDGSQASRLQAVTAMIACDDGRSDEADILSMEALGLAEASQDPEAIAEAYQVELLRLGLAGDIERAAAYLGRCGAGDAPHAPETAFRAHWILALLAGLEADEVGGDQHLAAALRLAESCHSTVLRAGYDELLGAALFRRGDWPAALSALGRSIDGRRTAGQRAALVRVLALAADVHLAEGRRSIAGIYLDEARTVIESLDPAPLSAAVPLWLALALWQLASRRIEEAYYAAYRAQAAVARAGWVLPAVSAVLPIVAFIATTSGRLDAARDALVSLQAGAARLNHGPGMAAYSQESGRLALSCEDWEAARDSLVRAVDAWTALNRPYELARSSLLLGRTCAALGASEEAASALLRSRQILQSLGAEPMLREVHRELTSLGIGGSCRSHEATVRSDVTEREMELIGLLIERSSTRAVAEQLVISEATVRTHIRNIFRKLGVRSRAELVALSRERPLAPPTIRWVST